MGKKVLVPIADGIEEIEVVCIIDTLRRAGAEVTVASIGALQVTGSRDVKIVADVTIANCADVVFDAIVLPGGMPGAEHLRDSAALVTKLKEQKASDRLLAAICASPAVVLHHHGLLKNVRATCYPAMQSQLDTNQVSSDRVVVHGQCVTGQGPAVAIEFALKLVEMLFGLAKAKEVSTALLVQA
jgi:protein deglycase